MENTACVSCLSPKSQFICDICQHSVCRRCAHLLDENSFSFLEEIPEHLSHGVYCRTCFDTHVQSELESYNATMEAAKAVSVFDKSKGKETRFLSRKEKLLQVKDCVDRDETILRLAFLAAKSQFNAIIDVDISANKIRNGSYQHHLWSGTARPTKLSRNENRP